MTKYTTTLLGVLFALALLSSCKKDDDEPADPPIPNEAEVITTLILTLTPDGGGDVKTFYWQDLDGDGGDEPIIIPDTLAINTVYTGAVQLLNELENPAEDITEEVQSEEEDEEHQFFYFTTVANLTIAYDPMDVDANGNPVGVDTQFTTGDAASGTLTVTLRHEPDKEGAGVSGGDITNAGGETDIEVEFEVDVE